MAVTEREIERMVRDHSQLIFRFLVYRTGDRDLAQDLLSDTFERALKARQRFDPRRGSERAWLTTIALNLVRDHARRAKAEQAMIVRYAADDHHDHIATVDERQTVLAALEQIPRHEREVIALVYGADLSAKQVAKALDLPVTTVHARLYRGLRRLKDEFGGEPPGR